MARAERKPPRAIAEIIRATLELPPRSRRCRSPARASSISEWRPRIGMPNAPRRGRRPSASGRAAGVAPGAGEGAGRVSLRQSDRARSPSATAATPCSATRIARLYEAAGFDVTREYYFNNGGRQMKLLGESVRARYLQEHRPSTRTMPEDGYQGEYIAISRATLKAEHGDSLVDATDLEIFRAAAVKAIFADISQTCDAPRHPLRRLHQRTRSHSTAAQVDAVLEGAARARPDRRAGRRGLAARRAAGTCPRIAVLVRSGPDARADLPHARHRLSHREAASAASI